MLNLFLDTEFTHLDDLSPEPPGLISIGVVSLEGKINEMLNLFLDTEFTHLRDPLLPAHAHLPAPQLISIGVDGLNGKRFYAENADAQLEMCSDFTREHVLPLLEGGDKAVTYLEIASRLKAWVETFGEPAAMWTDAPYFDWPFVEHLFSGRVSWPENLRRTPKSLAFANPVWQIRLKNAQAEAYRDLIPKLRQHHALDDAIANAWAFRRVIVKDR